MTTWARSRAVPILVVSAVVLLSAAAGMALVEDPATVLAVTALVAATGLFAVRPVVGLVAVSLTLPLQALLTITAGLTMTKALAPLICGTWAVRKVVLREEWRPALRNPFLPFGLLLGTFAVVSSVWAVYPDRAVASGQRLLFFIAWAVVVADLASTPGALKAVAKALVAAGIVAAVLTLHQYFGLGVRRAGDGISGGVDYTSTVLVTLIPLGFHLMMSESTRVAWRAAGLIYVVSAVAAVVVTFARMNMLVMPPLLAWLVWEALRESGKRRWGGVLAGVVVVLAATMVPWDVVMDRASTIGPELAAMFSGESGGGRGFHYRVGLAIFSDHLLLGAGYDSFGVLFLRDYQYLIPSNEGYLWGSVRSTHSSYLAMVADLGLVGLGLWLALIGSLFHQLRAAWRSGGRHVAGGSGLVRAYAYALGLQVLAYGWYANVHEDSFFWTLVGISVALWYVSTRERSSTTAEES